MLRLEGAQLFRTRLVLSVLSSRPVLIERIRENDERPGLVGFEVSFAKLVDKLTNGTSISIDATGTSVTMRPGFVVGGEIEHECEERGIGYFLEGVMLLCLFAKEPVQLRLFGVTNDDLEACVETFPNVTFPLVSRFGVERKPSLQVVQRGPAPNGRGEIIFRCAPVRFLKAAQILNPGQVRRIRGLAYAEHVSPQFANRMAMTLRKVFTDHVADIFINTDHSRNKDAAPGFGISLYAETTTNCVYGTKRSAARRSDLTDDMDTPSSSVALKHPGVSPITEPEELAENAGKQLLEEISQCGCVDSSHQSLLFLLMALGPEDVSKARIGHLTSNSILVLRAIKDFLGVAFRLRDDKEYPGTLVCSCLGNGYQNISRKVT